MYTEDEARTKWCPHSRVSLPFDDDPGANPQHSMNRYADWPDNLESPSDASAYNSRHPACFCVASQCMAWRWIASPEQVAAGNLWQGNGPVTKATGFCGLAGSPYA